jgi:nucleotide-binding universal stress UspA family protein
LGEQALEPARKLDPIGAATYVLMHAIPPFAFRGYLPYMDVDEFDPRSTQRQRAQAQAYLDRIAHTLRAEGRQVETVLCSKQQPAVAILEAAREQRADAIALATHGRGGVRRWLLGSVADKVVRASHTPVLLHHPQ